MKYGLFDSVSFLLFKTGPSIPIIYRFFVCFERFRYKLLIFGERTHPIPIHKRVQESVRNGLKTSRMIRQVVLTGRDSNVSLEETLVLGIHMPSEQGCCTDRHLMNYVDESYTFGLPDCRRGLLDSSFRQRPGRSLYDLVFETHTPGR